MKRNQKICQWWNRSFQSNDGRTNLEPLLWFEGMLVQLGWLAGTAPYTAPILFHVWKSQDVSCDDGGPYLTGTFAAKGKRSPDVLVSKACSTCQYLASTIQNDEDRHFHHFPQKRIETILWETLCFQTTACATGPELVTTGSYQHDSCLSYFLYSFLLSPQCVLILFSQLKKCLPHSISWKKRPSVQW